MALLRFLALAFCLAIAAGPQARGQYSTIYEAASKLNCSMLVKWLNIDDTGLLQLTQDPTLQVVFLTPTDEALNTQDFSFLSRVSGFGPLPTQSLPYLKYHMLTGVDPKQLSISDGLTLTTMFPSTPNTISNVTLRTITDGQVQAFGLAPGAGFDPALYFEAGLSRMYLVDNIIIPPGEAVQAALGVNALRWLPGLTVAQSLSVMGQSGNATYAYAARTFGTLIAADPSLSQLANSADSTVTMFLPTSTSLQRYLSAILGSLTLDQFKGTVAARQLVQVHILPARPYLLRDFPLSSASGNTQSFQTLYTGGDGSYITVAKYDTTATPVVTVFGVGNTRPLYVLSGLCNIWAGKSVIHIVESVILYAPANGPVPTEDPLPSPAMPSPTAFPPPIPQTGITTPSPDDSSQSNGGGGGGSSSVSLGVIGGAVAGGTVGILLVCGGLAWWFFKQRDDPSTPRGQRKSSRSRTQERERLTKQQSSGYRSKTNGTHGDSVQVYVVDSGKKMGRSHTGGSRRNGLSSMGNSKPVIQIPGFIYGDPFVRSTAPQYSWIDLPGEALLPGVEAGINDTALDTLATTGSSPIVRLSRADVVKKIKLLSNGLLGRGASALVFKCQWPGRFGTGTLLAVKVLRDPYEADPAVYESFCYEAAVLASVRHPNVVRMYAFCLELPTACIIMELCPGTLKDRLYRRAAGSSRSATQTASGHAAIAPLASNSSHSTSILQVTLSGDAAIRKLDAVAPPHLSVADKKDRTKTLSKTLPVVPDEDDNETDKPANLPPPPDLAAAAAAAAARVQSAEEVTLRVHSPAVTPRVGGSTVSSLPAPSAVDQLGSSTAQRGKSTGIHGRSTLNAPPGLTGAVELAPTSQNIQHPVRYNNLTMAEVLQLGSDVASGLAYLHKRPAVMSLPPHPTVMLEAPIPEEPEVLAPVTPHGTMNLDEDEEDEAKAVARIVHRDLKPSNILISSHGRCKISDFGLARWHNNTTVHTGTLGVGTLRYMAPELLLGHYSGQGPDSEPVTNRVDIYSLGMLCWEMATAQMPWTDLTDAQIVAAVIAQKRPNLDGGISEMTEPEVDLSSRGAIMALMRRHHQTAAAAAARGGGKPELPDQLAAFPELHAIINSCWQHSHAKRPTARTVQKALCALLMSYGEQQQSAKIPPLQGTHIP